MRSLVALFLALSSFTAHATELPGGETVGGPFKGNCQVLENGNEVDSFSFDANPESKVGIGLDNGLSYGDYFVQVVNDSFRNSLSVAVIFVRPTIENPPRLCMTKGGYYDCDFIKKRWSVPHKGAQPRQVPLAGSLEIIDSEGIRGGSASLVDSYRKTIGEDNGGFSEHVELKIKDSKTLKCGVSYVNLF